VKLIYRAYARLRRFTTSQAPVCYGWSTGARSRVEPKLSEDGKSYLPNGASAKAGLNAAILARCWGLIATFLSYKALRLNKLTLKIPPKFTSQEYAKCGHIHSDNRLSQDTFISLRQKTPAKRLAEDESRSWFLKGKPI
jgi:hypothetical protein